MRIVLPTRAAADAVVEYLRRQGCIVSYASGCALEASACPRSQGMEASEIEVEGYLRVWEELHPAVEVVKIFDLFIAH
jgi:hypothetical protein